MAALCLVPAASAATLLWTGASGADILWSTPANWDPAGPPAAADVAQFTDTALAADAVTINNQIPASTTVQGLLYRHTTGFHNTELPAGATLTIASAGTGLAFGVGTDATPTAVQTKSVNITGGGSIVVNAPTADVIVRQGSSAASGSSNARLDLSGLESFTADVAHLWVGVANPPNYPSGNRNTGFLLLARRNTIRAATSTLAAPGIDVGKSTSNNGGGSSLLLGQENIINSDMLGFGRVKEAGVTMRFNPAFNANGEATATFRAANGTDRVVNWTIGDGVTDGATTAVRGTNDFSGGTVDALVDLMVIGRTSSAGDGNVVHKGILTFDKGTIDVNTLRVAVQATAGANSQKSGDGVVNVNGDARLIVNTALEMGVLANANSPGAALTVATLNINGGEVNTVGIAAGVPARTTLIATNGGVLRLVGDAAVAGVIEAPLDRVDLADATIETFGGPARIVADTLFVGGTANTVNITAMPVISEYPARIPLIRFGFLEFETAFNLVLGTLPAATPAYQATLELNEAAGTVELVVTAGPVPVVLSWTGSASADWDFTSLNFMSAGSARAFANGDAVSFTDSASGPTTINLIGALEPGVVTVNNTTKTYIFAGDGALEGTAALTKSGTGTLILANTGPNTFSGGVNLQAGTLQVGQGGTVGSLPSSGIVNDANLIFNRSDSVTLTDAITGTGALTHSGTGTLTLAGSNGYSGATTVSAGSLTVNGNLPATSAINFSGGGTLSGGANIGGPVTISGRVDPGNGTAAGTLAVAGLTLNASSTLKFDLRSDTTPGGAFNDLLTVNGNLLANNNSVIVNFLGSPTLDVPYVLLTYSGTKTGNLNATVQGTHLTATLDQSVPGVVTVTFSGTGASLKWASTSSPEWDSTSLNWVDSAGNPSAFFAGDTATFDDSIPNVVTDINLGTFVVPQSVIVTSSANNFSISGSGRISGAGGIEKFGASTFTLATANDFTGAVNVHGGILKAGAQATLGATSGETTIMSGATLDLNGAQLNGERITVSGEGHLGVGAIINTGPQQINGVGRVVLAGNTTFGGTGRWDLRGGGANLSAGGLGYSITKVGHNQVSFVGATIDPTIRDIDIREGVFGIQTTTVQLSGGFGDPEGTITVQNGGTLETWALGAATPLFKKIVVREGGTIWNESGVSGFIGEVTLAGNATFNVGGTSLEFREVITGSGGFTKTGGGQLILSAINTYTGPTRIAAGSLSLPETGSIAASPSITVDAGATLTVAQRADTTLTLASGQTLSGAGSITGSVIVSEGATVAPTGPLTIANDLFLRGTTALDVGAGQTDSLRAAFITYGGTLNLIVNGTLPGGTVLPLFQATGFDSAFTAITPSVPGPGQTWNTSNLGIDGSITVVGDAVSPQFTSTTTSNGNLVLSGTGGAPNASFELRGSADLTVPVQNWAVDIQGTFNASGAFSITIPINPSVPYRFFVLLVGN